MGQQGMGVMLGWLGGNAEAVTAYDAALGKEIADARLRDDALHLRFNDGSAIRIWDDGQSCCESRYMQTDDDLSYHVGATLQGMEVLDAPNVPDEYGEHEVQFLHVRTSKGVFVMATHNEHNGYYGGFWLKIAASASESPARVISSR